MDPKKTHILAMNVGSSSVKLALFAVDNEPKKVFEAAIENIGQPSAKLVTHGESTAVAATDHLAAVQILTDKLRQQNPEMAIIAVGHRVVHGGPHYYEPQIINDKMLADLRELSPFDPKHLPVEIQVIETIQRLFPSATQVACFDTGFHHGLPTVARLLPIPRHFAAKGIRRYGFHGLSYAFVLDDLRRVEGEAAANGKVIIAHLGSGVSLTALRGGKSIDTTMGMTPASGVPMSTRSGDLDPGLVSYLAHTQHYDADKFNRMVNFESGLIGISETAADMKKLLEIEAQDERAKDAVDIFCYQVKKSIGALAAALGGLNTLVFTGGMGEHAPEIRARICEGLEFLGVTLDVRRNQESARLISADGSGAGVHVIHTDEATTIAREAATLLKANKGKDGHESNE